MSSSGKRKPQPQVPGEQKPERSRRTWSPSEEQALINGLKELVQTGWKADNGFKTGFLGILQHHMMQTFPGTDIRAEPHINSKIHVWKKNYGSLSTMLTRSGLRWNDTSKTIDIESDDVWEAYVKTDTNARTMRFKSWPYYKDWVDIFGKDRATGEHAEDFVDMTKDDEQTTVTSSNPQTANCSQYQTRVGNEAVGDYVPAMDFNMNEEDDDIGSFNVGQTSGTCNTNSSKKRKKVQADAFDQQFFQVMSTFSEKTENRLGEIARRIGFEHDRTAAARKEVFDALKLMNFLGIEEKIYVAKRLVSNTEELDIFFSLTEAERCIMARMIVDNSI